jgi:SAM-dependent methyltransferase
MWHRHTSRKTGQDYLFNPATGESKWPDEGGAAAAYGALAAAPDDASAADMRVRHNAWKREIIERYVCAGHCRVLDLACGRGGDIGKFARSGAATYVGVDMSPGCVAEARRRAPAIAGDMSTRIVATDLRCERLPVADATVDFASCQFALHYLAGDAAVMSGFLGEVGRVLADGGAFAATVPDEEEVRRLCAGEDPPPCVRVTAPRPFPSPAEVHRGPWGHAYLFEFVGRTPELTEYLVHSPALEDLAEPHGMVLERRIPPPPGSELYTSLVFRRKPRSTVVDFEPT